MRSYRPGEGFECSNSFYKKLQKQANEDRKIYEQRRAAMLSLPKGSWPRYDAIHEAIEARFWFFSSLKKLSDARPQTGAGWSPKGLENVRNANKKGR